MPYVQIAVCAVLPAYHWCMNLRAGNASSKLQLWEVWEHHLQFRFSFLLLSSKWPISASQTSCVPSWNCELWKQITSALSSHRRGGQREGSQEHLSWDLQSKERVEGAAQKAEGRASILQRFYFRTGFRVNMHDRDPWVLGTSSAHGSWWWVPAHCP